VGSLQTGVLADGERQFFFFQWQHWTINHRTDKQRDLYVWSSRACWHSHTLSHRLREERVAYIWKKKDIYFVWRESICFQELLELHLVIYFSPQHTNTNINCLCMISRMLLCVVKWLSKGYAKVCFFFSWAKNKNVSKGDNCYSHCKSVFSPSTDVTLHTSRFSVTFRTSM